LVEEGEDGLVGLLRDAREHNAWSPLVRAIMAHYRLTARGLAAVLRVSYDAVGKWATWSRLPERDAAYKIEDMILRPEGYAEAILDARERYRDGRGGKGRKDPRKGVRMKTA